MGTNSKHYNDHQRTFNNTSPSNKNQSSSSQRPSPSKSINIKTPNKNYNVAGKNNNYYNNNTNNNNNNNATRLSLSGSPTTSFFAASKCFESPSANSLPKPPSTWISNSTSLSSSTANRVRKALVMSSEPPKPINSCAMEFAAASSAIDKNDHFTQNLKLLLNVNA